MGAVVAVVVPVMVAVTAAAITAVMVSPATIDGNVSEIRTNCSRVKLEILQFDKL